MEPLGFDLRNEARLRTLTEDVIKSSEIEGVVEMMLDATEKFDEPLIEERLFDWQAALFPSGRSGMARIIAGY